jgi:hypothetical protein
LLWNTNKKAARMGRLEMTMVRTSKWMTGAAKVLNRGDEDGRRDNAEQGGPPDHRINPQFVRPVSHDRTIPAAK